MAFHFLIESSLEPIKKAIKKIHPKNAGRNADDVRANIAEVLCNPDL
ncbi:MAG: hypothetical protein ABIT96_12230 [Ferruginibacter sp.]